MDHRLHQCPAAANSSLLVDFLWFTAGLVLWLILRNDLWFVGSMSLYAIWITI
jgi:hypothetical protein